MKITINETLFEETNEIYPITDGVWYKNKWYKPVLYKENEWIIFSLNNSEFVRRIISDKEYNSTNTLSLREKYLEWMTISAANGTWQKQIVRKATQKEIYYHLQKLAKQKGLIKDAKVKRLNDDGFVNIVQEDDDYYIEKDEYCKSGIILYKNGEWVKKIEQPCFTFGGNNVSFKVVPTGTKYNDKTIEINCNGETGTHNQLETILTHYFRPVPFGKVFVKKWTRKNHLYTDIVNGIDVNNINDDIKIVNTVTIGCLTGTYKELVDIFNHCKSLLT